MPELEMNGWRLMLKGAKNLWATCVELVGELWVRLGQVGVVSHMQNSVRMACVETSGFVHYLYSAFADVLHITKAPFSSVNSELSHVSTWPIVTTTKYINK